MKIDKVLLAAAIAATLASFSTAGAATETQTEKCYGIVKAGQNGCANVSHACATLARKDRDRTEWIELPKGACERITGGSKSAS